MKKVFRVCKELPGVFVGEIYTVGDSMLMHIGFIFFETQHIDVFIKYGYFEWVEVEKENSLKTKITKNWINEHLNHYVIDKICLCAKIHAIQVFDFTKYTIMRETEKTVWSYEDIDRFRKALEDM